MNGVSMDGAKAPPTSGWAHQRHRRLVREENVLDLFGRLPDAGRVFRRAHGELNWLLRQMDCRTDGTTGAPHGARRAVLRCHRPETSVRGTEGPADSGRSRPTRTVVLGPDS